jgi:hypothetical protein
VIPAPNPLNRPEDLAEQRQNAAGGLVRLCESSHAALCQNIVLRHRFDGFDPRPRPGPEGKGTQTQWKESFAQARNVS